VRRAFLHYLRTWNAGRPIVVAGHSQGTLLLAKLMDEFFEKPYPAPIAAVGVPAGYSLAVDAAGDGNDVDEAVARSRSDNGCTVEGAVPSPPLLREQLVVAYLVGMQVWDGRYRNGTATVPLCDGPAATGCTISWMSYAVDGQPELFLHGHGLVATAPPAAHEAQVCTNPLSWRVGCEHVPEGSSCDNARVGREENRGALDIYQPQTNLLHTLGFRRWQDRYSGAGWLGNSWRAPQPHLVDAQCSGGYLRLEEPARYGYGHGPFPAWQAFTFPGKNYHAYDYNLYWESTRRNVGVRIDAFFAARAARAAKMAKQIGAGAGAGKVG